MGNALIDVFSQNRQI